MTKSQMEDYLLKNHWVEADTSSPWRWYDTNVPGIYYRLTDAASAQLAREREKKEKKK